MSTRFNWRLASRLSVITLAVLVVIIVALVQHNAATVSPTPSSSTSGGDTTSSGLQGSDLGGTSAPNFTLTDQNGQRVWLAQFKGQPVVLTFMYTHCPDVCPLAAERIHSTMQSLGSAAQKVAVLAVSTDPARDNAGAAVTFSQEHNLQGQNYWHFLIGSQQSLAPVWSSYSIYAKQMQQTTSHTSAIYVIDKQGNERVYLDSSDFLPAQLKTDLQVLLKE